VTDFSARPALPAKHFDPEGDGGRRLSRTVMGTAGTIHESLGAFSPKARPPFPRAPHGDPEPLSDPSQPLTVLEADDKFSST
jgi:hypothetical protein